jgi:DNA-binding NarL/FixJ family response regulator
MTDDTFVLEKHSKIITDTPPSIIIYYSKEDPNVDVLCGIHNNFNMIVLVINDQEQLLRFLSSTSKRISYLSLDIEYCQNLVNTTSHDYVRMLDTILSLRDNRVPIIGITKLDTDARLIKEFMNIPEVNGIIIGAAESNEEEMNEALTDLFQKKFHIPKRIKQKIQELKKKKKIVTSGEIVLTPRQTQILNLVLSKGASNKVIANILKISESTVKLHITSILRKYGLRNRTQLALFAKTKD